MYRAMGGWTDQNNRPLLYEMDGGVVRTCFFAIMVGRDFPLLNL